ncbi:MAG: winged helix-turn-helix domain-containing protein [Phycisphaeraceae bacterium]|nr:winged helix-turn-helix domain-containing protein [Phycisphaeraceae bacterium]
MAKSPMGRPPKLPVEQHQAFKQRVLGWAGCSGGCGEDGDGVCALRGRDFVRILKDEFGVSYKLSGVYVLLDRLNLSVRVPRPQHRKSDPQGQAQWTERAPLLPVKSNDNTPKNKLQFGSRTKPAPGSWPARHVDARVGRAWQLPACRAPDRIQMGLCLWHSQPHDGPILCVDLANGQHGFDEHASANDRSESWQRGACGIGSRGCGLAQSQSIEGARIDDAVVLVAVCRGSPELMPMERVWQWMRQHDLSNRVFKNETAIDQACKASWNKLTPARLKTITRTKWLTHEN